MIVLVNKNNLFNEDDLNNFQMIEYENYNEDTLFVERETFRHFEMLRAHLKIDDIFIDIGSAYRSLESQENIFLEYMRKYGEDYASEVVAMPGTTDHHTGQGLDLVIQKNGKWLTGDSLAKETEIFTKIHECLKYFGFILRYPKDKEMITGFEYEPWHIRYIGEKAAMEIGSLALEEYLMKEKGL